MGVGRGVNSTEVTEWYTVDRGQELSERNQHTTGRNTYTTFYLRAMIRLPL